LLALLHVSDVHFGPKHLSELSAAVVELARERRPAAIVVSGDLTQRAKPRQFRAAREWIARLPAPVAFVPGNHDVPMYRFWERFFAPLGAWKRHFSPEPVREVVGEGFAVRGLNTAHAWTSKHGRVLPGELARVERELAASAPEQLGVVVSHHPLAPSPYLGREPVARGGARALERLGAAGADLVLAGHLHHGFWVRPEPGSAAPLVLHCGTTCSSRGRGSEAGRNSLNWIEIDARTVRVERRFWDRARGEFAVEQAAELPRRIGPGSDGSRR
jgi:3',5'-cyclic AMP phosphodiesterase CpdA